MTQTTNPETVPPQPLSMEGFPRICKRDGSVLDFDATRISRAIAKAGAVTAEFDENTARRLCLKVLALLPVAASDAVPTLEEVQDLVEEVLREVVADVIEVRASGEGDLAQLLDLALIGDFVSLHLAANEGIDPGPIPVLDEMKQQLRRGAD